MKVTSGQVQWPSGKVTSLQLPESLNPFVVVRYPPGHPEQAQFVSTVLSREDLFHNFFHYYITKPAPLRRCQTCRKSLESLCIQTDSICILYKYFL
jgi:hypothetical protein